MKLETHRTENGCRVGLVTQAPKEAPFSKGKQGAAVNSLVIIAPTPQAALRLVETPQSTAQNLGGLVQDVLPVPDPVNDPFGERCASHDKGRNSFHGTASWETYMEMCFKDPTSLIQWTEADEKLVGPVDGRDVQYDLTGQWLDVARFVQGEPDCFGSPTGDGTPRGFVQLLHSGTYTAGVDQRSIRMVAADILQMIDRLESNNIRVRLTSVQVTTNCLLVTDLKTFDAPFDAGQLSIGLHPDWQRRYRFRAQEIAKGKRDYGYGQSPNHQRWSENMAQYHGNKLGIDPADEHLPTIHVGNWAGYDPRKAQELKDATEELVKNLGVWS